MIKRNFIFSLWNIFLRGYWNFPTVVSDSQLLFTFKLRIIYIRTGIWSVDTFKKAIFFQNEQMHFAKQSSGGKVDWAGNESLEHTMACNSILPNLALVSSWFGSSQTSGHCFSRKARVVQVGRKWETQSRFQNEYPGYHRKRPFILAFHIHLEYLLNVCLVIIGSRRCHTGYIVSLCLRNGKEGIKADKWRLCCIYTVFFEPQNKSRNLLYVHDLQVIYKSLKLPFAGLLDSLLVCK